MANKVTIGFRIPPELHEIIEKHCEIEFIDKSEFIRRALVNDLKRLGLLPKANQTQKTESCGPPKGSGKKNNPISRAS
jgi:Arc/MetJ-type ribon-helix-helix transcriptional regulator